MRKSVLKSLVGCFIAIITFSILAIAAEFSADMISNQMGGNIKSKIYVKGDKVRMDGTDPQGESSITIIDIKKGTMYALMPQEKMYIEMSGMEVKPKISQFNFEEEIAKIADKRHVGTESVNGYLCDKYEFIYHDKVQGTMTQWYSKKLNYPIKMVYRSSYGEMATEYKNIKEGRVSDLLFEIPPGYQKMAMPGFRR